jgi:Arc/MetJ-type ribon-helix-helix transcriptional regulator
MVQAKFSLSQSLLEFLDRYQVYGFRDKSAMVRAALQELQAELERQDLQQSANLYAELYETDTELQELTEVAVTGWPE